ncbi:MAG: hypothetical protein BGP06_09035 [Rhizobiales bacterium 65-9]|nr:SGNH/GDSL hydrolase family protein [Hyphomicrobiales bacterium]OJY38613.1 MAG: hypothetical protein BGP06_09035 [Rhizobiales bacterium 65-9]
MAFRSQGSFATVALLGLTAALAALPARAAEGLADICNAPQALIAATGPLPRVEGLLKDRQPVKVLAIGSSSTVGVGASSPKFTYTSLLETELEKAFKGLDIKIATRGVSGEVAEGTAHRIKLEAALLNPDLVLWQVGTNDALSRIPVADFTRTVSKTLKWLKAHRIDVVLVGMQYTKQVASDDHYRLIKDALKQVAAEEGVALVKRYEAMKYIEDAAGKEPLISADNLHLNDLGYRCMAEHVARVILVSVFPKQKPPTASLAPTN